MDFALVTFDGVNTAAEAFASGRERSPATTQWAEQAGLVEHHEDGHLVLRGVFAGRYVDADEASGVSEAGAAKGWGTGALLGLLLTPAGFAAGSVLGAAVGSQVAAASETEPEPTLLANRLRATVPVPGSAIALVAPAAAVDEMLGALGTGSAHVTRRTLNDDDLATLNAAMDEMPTASLARPAGAGDAAPK